MAWLRFGRSNRQTPPKGSTSGEIFTRIVEQGYWRGRVTRSGAGSMRAQTQVIEREIPRLLRSLGATSLLDIPCGDFHWMQHVDLAGIDYVGADVVAPLIKRNQEYVRPGRRFVVLDLLNDPLPRAELVLVRDCLVHFSYADIARALRNVLASGSRYLLTGTFPARPANKNIQTGQWRALNLQLAPFEFPQPLQLISEGCTEDKGKHADKSLGLWELAALKERIARL